MTENIIRLTPTQAAQLFGVNERTIRRAIKAQELRYVVVRGRYKINFESMVDWSQRNSNRQVKLDQAGIGQYVDKWKIKNKLYSPNPETVKPEKIEKPEIQNDNQKLSS